jgi:hypothetical protein
VSARADSLTEDARYESVLPNTRPLTPNLPRLLIPPSLRLGSVPKARAAGDLIAREDCSCAQLALSTPIRHVDTGGEPFEHGARTTVLHDIFGAVEPPMDQYSCDATD